MADGNSDKTWVLDVRVRVTTYCGWKPGHSDVEEWLEEGSHMELVSILATREAP